MIKTAVRAQLSIETDGPSCRPAVRTPRYSTMLSRVSRTSADLSTVKKSVVLLAVFLLHVGPSYSDVGEYYPSNGRYYGPQSNHISWDDFSSDDSSSGVDDKFSTPEECKRECKVGEHKTCYYHFHIEYYTTVNKACDQNSTLYQCVLADGFERTIYSINRQLPGPSIEVCKGDWVIVDVENDAEGSEFTIHWHGLFQNGYQYYDGVPYLTQCPIHSSNTFRYLYRVDNSGTHFYHSHLGLSMVDGVYGKLIVRDPREMDPQSKLYDFDDLSMLISDWSHKLAAENFPGNFRHDPGQVPLNILIDGRGTWTNPDTKETTNVGLTTYEVQRGKCYRIRIINSFSSVCLARSIIHGHNMTVIAQDGENIKPVVVNAVILASGERVDVVVCAYGHVDSYWIEVTGLGECKEKKVRQFGLLRYKGANKTPSRAMPAYSAEFAGREYNTLNVTNCEEQKKLGRYCISSLEGLEKNCELGKDPDFEQLMSFGFYSFDNPKHQFERGKYDRYLVAVDRSQVVSLVNNKSFSDPASPLISQHDTVKSICPTNTYPSTCNEPCYCTDVFHVPLDITLQIILYDISEFQDLTHPFHLHGSEFQVLKVGYFPNGASQEAALKVLQEYDKERRMKKCGQPSSKDTIVVPSGGYVILRFKTNNPGWWLFHCHFTYHTATGMNVVIRVGTDKDLPPVPEGFPTCDNYTPDPRKKRKHHRPHHPWGDY